MNGALSDLSADSTTVYASLRRPSIPPEKLPHTIRPEHQLIERLKFKLLCRWFIGIGIDDAVRDHSVFSKYRDRLLEGYIAAKLMAAVLT